MARMPTPGADEGQWGDILNAYLDVAHTPTGELKPGVVNESMLASGVQDKINTAFTGAQGPQGEPGPQGAPGTTSWNDLNDKPAVIAAGANAAVARSVISAGTSNLALGTTSSTAKAGNWQPAMTDLPAGSTVSVYYTGTWPSRPTARTDITTVDRWNSRYSSERRSG